MSLETFIRAMPKVEINVHLEGALTRETLLMIAEQNDTASTMKPRQWSEWQALVNKPDGTRIDDMMRTFAGWLKHPEDLVRMVYDLGLSLSRQNIRYAEVSINPTIYTDAGMSFEGFLEAINDGRDRVERAWKTRMNWILTIPRDNPRRADDIARWTTLATARKGNVVGIGIFGREDSQPAGQFTKAFNTVEKKGMGRVCQARTLSNVEPLVDILDALNPSRITDSWGIVEDETALALLAERGVPLVVTPAREVSLGRIASHAEYPLATLVDNIRLVLSGGLPELYQTTLTDEYLAAAKQGLEVQEIEKLVVNSIQYSFLAEEDKQAMLAEFETAFQQQRSEHLADA
jgi:aminodeoxyfutalosine deaminase